MYYDEDSRDSAYGSGEQPSTDDQKYAEPPRHLVDADRNGLGGVVSGDNPINQKTETKIGNESWRNDSK